MTQLIETPQYTLYQGDCLDFMRGMEAGSVDAVVTDPPYGIADVWKGGFGRGWAADSLAIASIRNGWDVTPNQEIFDLILALGKTQIIWGGNYFNLPVSRGWLVWVKPERGFSLSEAELAWTNLQMPMRVFESRRSDPDREHPTQKTIRLMKWCVGFTTASIVFDPFMGSGTTGVACAQLGRRFVGCEIDPGYFEIARKRTETAYRQTLLPLDLG